MSVHIVLFGSFYYSIPSPGWTTIRLVSFPIMNIQVGSVFVLQIILKEKKFPSHKYIHRTNS